MGRLGCLEGSSGHIHAERAGWGIAVRMGSLPEVAGTAAVIRAVEAPP
jgi:hypothetical protein